MLRVREAHPRAEQPLAVPRSRLQQERHKVVAAHDDEVDGGRMRMLMLMIVLVWTLMLMLILTLTPTLALLLTLVSHCLYLPVSLFLLSLLLSHLSFGRVRVILNADG